VSTSGLTYDLRGLVWGIESEVAVITSLCRQVDEHVVALNGLRTELAERLERLDALREAAGQEHLLAWLDAAAAAPLPAVVEHFPDRLYAD
jgi:hypothetical protein